MSTQNFVSYGDAETLMSGIKSAIDDAGGGGTVTKKTIAEYTTGNLTDIGALLFTELKKLNNNELDKCYIEIIGIASNIQAASSFLFNHSKLLYGLHRDSGLSNEMFYFGTSFVQTSNIVATIVSNGIVIRQGTNTAIALDTDISGLNIAKIGLYYDELEGAVVPSGETVVASVNASFSNTYFGTIAADLYTALQDLSDDVMKKIKLRSIDSSGNTICTFITTGVLLSPRKAAKFLGTYIPFTADLAYEIIMSIDTSPTILTLQNANITNTTMSYKYELYYDN